MMYSQKCTITRMVTSKGERNRPAQSSLILGPFPCATSRPGRSWKNYDQGAPLAEITVDLVLYGAVSLDIKAGDVVEVDGEKYIASHPYRPRNHHTECGLRLERSV